MANSKFINIKLAIYVLLIEDDPDLSTLIMDYLKMEAIKCDNATNGSIGLKLATEDMGKRYDCIILDINLPLLDGLTLCKELRKNKIDTPIIMLTARDGLEDKLEGFALGADDYLCKPFEMRELVARIKALTHRKTQIEELSCADLVMNLKTGEVRRGQKTILLTQIEWKILRLLLASSPGIISKSKIVEEIWGDDPPESDSLKVHMHNLRKHINFEKKPALLHTIARHGYQISCKC